MAQGIKKVVLSALTILPLAQICQVTPAQAQVTSWENPAQTGSVAPPQPPPPVIAPPPQCDPGYKPVFFRELNDWACLGVRGGELWIRKGLRYDVKLVCEGDPQVCHLEIDIPLKGVATCKITPRSNGGVTTCVDKHGKQIEILGFRIRYLVYRFNGDQLCITVEGYTRTPDGWVSKTISFCFKYQDIEKWDEFIPLLPGYIAPTVESSSPQSPVLNQQREW
jgi:hypothetical protein